MKMVELCAQWYETKSETINSESDQKLVEWADFCKKCSEFLKKN